MPTLLEISDDLLALRSLLEESDGEVTEANAVAIETWFSELEHDQERKLDSYAALIKDWLYAAAVRKEEAKRMLALAEADENNAKRLKERLRIYFIEQGISRFDTPRFRLSVCGNGGLQKVDVLVDPRTLPVNFQKETVTADTDALRLALELGEEIPGVRLAERGTHIRIS